MADGQTFTRGGVIRPGWELRLPLASAAGTDVEVRTYVVQPGDTLSRIAGQLLGDREAWPEIFALNRGQARLPDGRTLTRPELIWPGLELRVPVPVGEAVSVAASAAPAPAPEAALALVADAVVAPPNWRRRRRRRRLRRRFGWWRRRRPGRRRPAPRPTTSGRLRRQRRRQRLRGRRRRAARRRRLPQRAAGRGRRPVRWRLPRRPHRRPTRPFRRRRPPGRFRRRRRSGAAQPAPVSPDAARQPELSPPATGGRPDARPRRGRDGGRARGSGRRAAGAEVLRRHRVRRSLSEPPPAAPGAPSRYREPVELAIAGGFAEMDVTRSLLHRLRGGEADPRPLLPGRSGAS